MKKAGPPQKRTGLIPEKSQVCGILLQGLKERYVHRYRNQYIIDSPNSGCLMRLFHQTCGKHGIVHSKEQIPAQCLVVGRQGHLYHALGPFIDLFKQVDVPEDPIGLGDKGSPEAMFIYESEGLPDVSQLQFQWNVGVGHGAHTDHTSAALPPERIRQQWDDLLTFGSEIEVLEPPELRPMLAELGRAIYEKYRD